MKKNMLAVLCGVFAATSAQAELFGSSDYYSCILDQMVGVANDYAASTVVQGCSAEFDWQAPINRRSGSFARYSSGDECFLDKGKGIISMLGARMVFGACHSLYDPPSFDPSHAVPVK